jgi:hypothetical protein
MDFVDKAPETRGQKLFDSPDDVRNFYNPESLL